MIKFQKIKGDPRKHFKKLVKFFKEDQSIVAAYLFGSYATENIGPLSDIDLAILLSSKFPPEKYFDKQLELLGKVCHLLKTDEVDLVILNKAASLISYGITRNGKVIFSNDEKERIRFETKVINRYLDTKKIRDEYFNFLFKRIREGRMVSEHRQRKFEQSLRKTERMFGKTKALK